MSFEAGPIKADRSIPKAQLRSRLAVLPVRRKLKTLIPRASRFFLQQRRCRKSDDDAAPEQLSKRSALCVASSKLTVTRKGQGHAVAG